MVRYYSETPRDTALTRVCLLCCTHLTGRRHPPPRPPFWSPPSRRRLRLSASSTRLSRETPTGVAAEGGNTVGWEDTGAGKVSGDVRVAVSF